MVGVHTNSGIVNKAAYNVIKAVGAIKAEQIYYNALCNYMTESTDFAAAKAYLMQAARDMAVNNSYGITTSDVDAINTAFSAVGIN